MSDAHEYAGQTAPQSASALDHAPPWIPDFTFAGPGPTGALGRSARAVQQAWEDHRSDQEVLLATIDLALDEETEAQIRREAHSVLQALRTRAQASERVLHDLLEVHVVACRRALEYVTPREAARATGLAESTWRNKAAAGQIPGAIKKGKQWLLPHAGVRSSGVARAHDASGATSEDLDAAAAEERTDLPAPVRP